MSSITPIISTMSKDYFSYHENENKIVCTSKIQNMNYQMLKELATLVNKIEESGHTCKIKSDTILIKEL